MILPAMLIAVMVVLVSASLHDLRSREVPDMHWMIICAIGLFMLAAALFDGAVTIQRIMILIGSAMIVVDILYDKERSLNTDMAFYGLLAVMFAVPMATGLSDEFVLGTLAIPICYLLFVVLFFSGVIKGGADVKCLVSLAIAFPMYPVLFGLPLIGAPEHVLSSVVSFPLAVLLYASILSMMTAIPLAVMNARRGDKKLPNMLIGYRVDAQSVDRMHVWPMKGGPAEDGKVWVTPKIPFIVPITAAFALTIVLGNVLFLI